MNQTTRLTGCFNNRELPLIKLMQDLMQKAQFVETAQTDQISLRIKELIAAKNKLNAFVIGIYEKEQNEK